MCVCLVPRILLMSRKVNGDAGFSVEVGFNPTLNKEEVMKTYYISLAAYIVVEVEAETQEAAHQSAGDLLIDSVNDLEDLDCSLVRILDVQDQEELDFVNSLNLPDDPVAGLIMLDIHKTQSTTLIIRDDESLLH